MNFEWHPDENPPLLEEHSKAKLDVLRGYLRTYIRRLNNNPSRDKFKLDLVDGFAGGGIYSSNQGDILSGSPLIMLEEISEAENELNQDRKKPLRFDCKFYFVDKEKAHTDHLRKALTDRGYKANGDDISIFTGPFKNYCNRIIDEIKRRQPRSGRAIFLLDQTGYSQVDLRLIRDIFSQLASAEIILTFAADVLINYLSNKPDFIKSVAPIELSDLQIRTLIESGDGAGGKALIQRTLLNHVCRATRAPFYTPFFIRPERSRRALWFLHLSRHPTARDVMIQHHWSTYNTFEHYGTGGLRMLGWDTLQESETVPLFTFKEHDSEVLREELLEPFLYELVSLASDQPVTYDSVRMMYANRTAARFSDLDKVTLQLAGEQEIEILGSDGKARSKNPKSIHPTDLISIPRTLLVPGFSRLSKNFLDVLGRQEQRSFSTELGTASTMRSSNDRFTNLDPDKLRGGYYTPARLATWLSSWAIRSTNDRILEPSCGDGTFLETAAARLEELGYDNSDRILGLEILSAEAAKARQRLKIRYGSQARNVVKADDFFAWWNRIDRPSFDAVIGNPPFIRYQSFPEPHRSRAMDIMKSLGLAPNRLTNIWVPFVAAVTACLRPGGRLALVLPAELLQVGYAAQLRSFLTDHFRRIHLITCNELFFANAEQEVLLFLAEDALQNPSSDNTCQITLSQTSSVAEILDRPVTEILRGSAPKMICHDSEKWLKYFLSDLEIDLMRTLRASDETTTLKTFADINVGIVTGKNQFFVLRRSEINNLGIIGHTIPLVSRSMHLKGARIRVADWKQLANADNRVHLLDLAPLNGSELPPELNLYIKRGEMMRVNQGYKCSIRTPWYVVPAVWVPDAFVFRQIYDFPRVVLNESGATATDTIHRMKCRTDPKQIVANTYTYLTAASAEIEGRSYGGGVLELEPTEATNLLMPAQLANALPVKECDRLIRQGRLKEVLVQNERLVLRDQIGLSVKECAQLRVIWEKMRTVGCLAVGSPHDWVEQPGNSACPDR